MRKRRPPDVAAEYGAREDVEAAVRAAAQSIAGRFDSFYPNYEDLADDPETVRPNVGSAESRDAQGGCKSEVAPR
jgi:hypothetical protein